MKKILVMSLTLLGMFNAQAQGGDKSKHEERKENMEAMKVAFITKELDLTPEEAQKFWPVYNQREAELDAVRKEMRQMMKGKKLDDMSDAEVEKMIDTQMDLQQKELDIDKAYTTKFRAILPVKKVAKLHIAEHKFKAEVMRQWKEKHQGGPAGPGGPARREPGDEDKQP